MNKFLLSISNWGSDYKWEFLHPSKNEDDFKNDVNQLLKDKCEDFFNSKSFRIFKTRSGEYITKETYLCHSDLLNSIVPFLYEIGYKKTEEYTGFYSMTDLGIINTRTKKSDSEEYKELENIVGKVLLNKIVKHNNKVENE